MYDDCTHRNTVDMRKVFAATERREREREVQPFGLKRLSTRRVKPMTKQKRRQGFLNVQSAPPPHQATFFHCRAIRVPKATLPVRRSAGDISVYQIYRLRVTAVVTTVKLSFATPTHARQTN